MINPKLLEGISEQIGQLFEQTKQRSVESDLQSQINALLQGAFRRMELVTREEFDAQSAVLARTRMKLEQLEQQLEQLENSSKPDS